MGWRSGFLGGLFDARVAGRAIEHGERIRAEEGPQPVGRTFLRRLRARYVHTDGAGRRRLGWRVWFLLWLLAGLFAATTAGLGLHRAYAMARATAVTAEVLQVYTAVDDTPFDRGQVQYTPVFAVTASDGRQLRLTPGLRHADLDLAVGTRHALLHDPAGGRVILPGRHNREVAGVIGLIALMALALALPAPLIHHRLRDRQRPA